MTPKLKWLMALGLVLVFLAGAATGLFAGARHARQVFIGHHGEMMGERMRQHLKRRLELTPEQVQLADPIMAQTAQQLQAIHAETRQRVAEVMEQSRRDLSIHLTPAQQEKLEEMRQRHLRRLERRGRHREGHQRKHRRGDAP